MAKTALWLTFSGFGYLKDTKDFVTHKEKIKQEILERKNKRK
jgi:hypothetical protein